MNVIKSGEVYKASRITGPKHNYLGLVFCSVAPPKVALQPRSIPGEQAETQIDQEKLVTAVLAGVQAAKQTVGKNLNVKVVEFVPGDTPDYEAYEALAKEIFQAAWKDFA